MRFNLFRSTWNASIGLGLLVLGAGTAWASYQEFRQARPYANYQSIRITSSTGNEIEDYFSVDGEEWIVLIPGLSSSVSSVVGIADNLRAQGYSVLMHNRAGYGASAVLAETPFHMGESVADLHAVLLKIGAAAGKKVHLVGHSLGGYIAYLYASQYPGQVASISYLDPLHPLEMVKSRAQRQGSLGVELSVKTITPFVRFGVTLLYRSLVLDYAKKYPYQKRILSDLGAYSVWSATRREWKTLYPLLLDGKPISSLSNGIKTQVLAAESTVKDEKIQLELYHDYSECIHVITGADHQTLVTELGKYRQAVCHISKLVNQ